MGFDQDSKVQVRITLQRVFVFHLTNTYMPGLCLVRIAFVLFVKSYTNLVFGQATCKVPLLI